MAAAKHSKNRKHPARKLVVLLLVFALAGGAIYFSAKYFTKASRAIENAVYPLKYTDYVNKAALDYDLDQELIYAVIHTESHFDPDAESSAGAIGLMQLTGDTYSWLCNYRGEEQVEDGLLDPAINIDFGCYFLRYLLDEFGDEKLAVAAYNAGPNNVIEWLENPDYSSDGVTLDNIPFEETDKYVERVESAKAKYTELYFS